MEKCNVNSKIHGHWISRLIVEAYATQYICLSRFNFTIPEYRPIHHDIFMAG